MVQELEGTIFFKFCLMGEKESMQKGNMEQVMLGEVLQDTCLLPLGGTGLTGI